MKYYLPALIFLFFSTIKIHGQGVSGTVIDQDGNPLPFTTIYVTQTGSGSISNQAGKYELKLEPGLYNINFQFLGYKSEQIQVEVGSTIINKDVVLQKQAYLLGTAEIDGGKEDPAYKIMRKAIAKSGYHRQQVDAYTCEVYLKGGGRLVDVPWFLRKTLEKEGIDTASTFVVESVSELSYTRPGKYTERVISIRSSGDNRDINPMNYINGSLYEPKVGPLVSPLSPRAFAYYKFKYIRSFEDRGLQVNEISVIPRSMGEDVFAGKLFIVEDLWCIHSLDLAIIVQGIDIDIKQVFAPVAETAWLPVSHLYDGNGKVLGVSFEFQYLATVSDYDVTINPDLQSEVVVLDEKTEKEAIESRESEPTSDLGKTLSETQEKLEKGEELTRKEMRQILKDYEKAERKAEDEPTVIENRTFNIDSLAFKSDSSYWAERRPLPLTEREIKGYQVQDSLVVEQQKKNEGDTLNTGKGNFKITDLVLGNTYNLGKDNYLTVQAPYPTIRFNTVDGWNFEYELNYIKRFKKDKRLEISPLFRYTFARDRGFGKVKTEYRYGSGLKRSKIAVTGGWYYSQFNKNEPITPFTDAISTLFVENHYMKVYDKNFIDVDWATHILHNLLLMPSVSFAERKQTYNNTSQVIFPIDDKDYTPNTPVSAELPNTNFGRSLAAKSRLALAYRPGARYFIRNEKYFRANNPPTITAAYEMAIPDIFGSSADYDLVTLEFKNNFDLNLLGKINLRIEGGKFLRNNRTDFMDYAHFMGNQTIFTRFAQMEGYSIAPYYLFSTNDEYITSYVNYEFRQFLLTNIRVLRLTGVKENINFNYLATPTAKNYAEIGYSIDNLFRFFRIDCTASFLDGEYYDFRIQLGITSDLISF